MCTLKLITKPFSQSQNRLDSQKTIAITSINVIWESRHTFHMNTKKIHQRDIKLWEILKLPY